MKNGNRFQDLTGQVFGRLTVLSLFSKGNGKMTKWNCQCNCFKKNIVTVSIAHLKTGHTRSCGCLNIEGLSNRGTHKLSKTRLYRIWIHMKTRCYNENHQHFKYYGGKGIKICDEWLSDNNLFFKWANDNGYTDFLSIERDDNDKDYAPSNCRWISQRQQVYNRSNMLSKDVVIEIKEMIENKMPNFEISTILKVSRCVVSKIKNGLSYSEYLN